MNLTSLLRIVLKSSSEDAVRLRLGGRAIHLHGGEKGVVTGRYAVVYTSNGRKVFGVNTLHFNKEKEDNYVPESV